MKPRIAVHKFSSCDGCQLAFLNAGEALLELARQVEIVHFAEAGYLDEQAEVDIAFVEGSVSTPHERQRIAAIRKRSKYLIVFGACATAGGIQALRNMADKDAWMADVYASPQYIEALATSSAVSEHVRVDLEIWGCPPNARQVLGVVRDLLSGVEPVDTNDKVCLECKRQRHVCVMVAKGLPCMGPVTRTGCGALCPSVGRDCYACYGPAENPAGAALAHGFQGLGLQPDAIARRFLFINNGAPAFKREGERWKGIGHE